MSRFRPIQREVDNLFSQSMNNGLPGQHMARFIVEIVDPLSAQALAVLRELLTVNGR